MPAAGSRTELLVDTSVAIALVVEDHEDHKATSSALADRRLGLSGHAAFEAISVLTRLPAPVRRTPETVVRLLEASFPRTRFLGSDDAAGLLSRLGELEIAGGAVYDALVGECARAHRLPLATRDRRALEVYRALDVEVELLG